MFSLFYKRYLGRPSVRHIVTLSRQRWTLSTSAASGGVHSSNSLSFLDELHSTQTTRMLATVDRPPRDMGITWSITPRSGSGAEQ